MYMHKWFLYAMASNFTYKYICVYKNKSNFDFFFNKNVPYLNYCCFNSKFLILFISYSLLTYKLTEPDCIIFNHKFILIIIIIINITLILTDIRAYYKCKIIYIKRNKNKHLSCFYFQLVNHIII